MTTIKANGFDWGVNFTSWLIRAVCSTTVSFSLQYLSDKLQAFVVTDL